MSLETILYLNVVLGTLEIHWMLVSFIRKKWWSNDNLRQARMIDEILSTTSNHCYLDNKYLLHAYICCFRPLVGCLMACNSLFAKVVFLAKFFISLSLVWASWDECICWELYKSYYWFTQSHICQSSNFIAYHFLKVLSCAILIWLQTLPSLWYLLPLSKHPNYLVFLHTSCDVFDGVYLKSFNVP